MAEKVLQGDSSRLLGIEVHGIFPLSSMSGGSADREFRRMEVLSKIKYLSVEEAIHQSRVGIETSEAPGLPTTWNTRKPEVGLFRLAAIRITSCTEKYYSLRQLLCPIG